jgi:acetyltransferase-like isoleucine patch superfamily enzyme
MKQITQKEFDDLPIVNGLRECPKSDFSQIKFLGKVVIPDWSIIGYESEISERSIIGNHVIIGHDVIIRAYAKIGNYVKIANRVKIDDFAQVGNQVKFGNDANIGHFVEFGESVKFGYDPIFGCRTKFKAGTAFVGKGIAKPGYPIRMFQGFGSENSDIYFYNLVSGIYVKEGYFLGTTEEFIEKTKSDGDAKKLAEYILMVQMAELGFSN